MAFTILPLLKYNGYHAFSYGDDNQREKGAFRGHSRTRVPESTGKHNPGERCGGCTCLSQCMMTNPWRFLK